jgi:hypothetical protein
MGAVPSTRPLRLGAPLARAEREPFRATLAAAHEGVAFDLTRRR